MSKESDNKATVGRWFTDFWGETCNLAIVDELAHPDMLLQFSLHEPRRAAGPDGGRGRQNNIHADSFQVRSLSRGGWSARAQPPLFR